MRNECREFTARGNAVKPTIAAGASGGTVTSALEGIVMPPGGSSPLRRI